MKIIFRILNLARDYTKEIVIATLTLILITAVNLAVPAFIRELVAILEGKKSYNEPLNIIIIIAVILFVLYVLRVLFQFASNYCAHKAAWNSVAKCREQLYAHIQGLSLKFFSDKQTGQLMARVLDDTTNFEMLIAHALPDLVSSILVFVGVLIILLIINPLLALFTCIPLPLIFLCTKMLKKMRKYFSERQKRSAELHAILQDNFSGIKEIQVFNREDYERENVGHVAREHARLTMRGIFYVSWLHPLIAFFTGIGTIIVYLAGGIFALNNKMDVSDIVAFVLYLSLFYSPIATLSRILEDIQNGIVSGGRYFEIMDIQSDIKEKPQAISVGRTSGQVKFQNVSFDYVKDIAVLKDVSFEASPGKMIALVGPTGAGKSTIVSLLARFYDPVAGKISMDGIDISDMKLSSLRNQISIVLQDVFLFNGTIAQNIVYGRSGATPEEIVEAAKVACVHDFIDALPAKYDTMIGERGVRLSGGQKQRLSIARAVLRNSPILIMDEATSAIDNETETEIQKAIAKLVGRSTLIVIAHRLSTIERADEILVLSEGGIVERGTHGELLAKDGAYSRLQK